jgi:hypothetical protein
METITPTDIQDMVNHWLNTPVNGYFGSDYGQDLKALLQQPQLSGLADETLAKLTDDVPILQILPLGSTNIYGVHTQPDRLDLVIEVAGTAIQIGNN